VSIHLSNLTFSIVTVSYNSAEFIDCTIKSVLSQDYVNIEYIVVDGESIDGTVKIVKSFGNSVTKFVSESDKGIYDAMNKGIALATGEVIGILNSDDFYPNVGVLTEVEKLFAENPSVDMILGNVDFVLPDNLTRPVRLYSSFNFKPWKMRFGFMPAHPAAFISRAAYERVGAYALGYKIGADFEWFVRAFLVHKLTYVKINKTLVRMREGGVSTSGMESYQLSSKEQARSLRLNGIYSNLFFVLIRLPIKFFHKFLRRG
jgi:glycosyltransferase involved in cell wall biosynthesis